MTREELHRRYPIGCRVRATARFHEQFRVKPGTDTAVVVGYGNSADDLIRVVRTGQSSVQTYHANFWEPEEVT